MLSRYIEQIEMTRIVGITCSLLLFFASALWAIERCDGFNIHHGSHEYGRAEIAHSHTHGVDLVHGHSSGDEPTIHCCADSYKNIALIVQLFQRIADPVSVGQLVLISSLSDPRHGPGITRSDDKPPGPFLSGVLLYLSFSVLRV